MKARNTESNKLYKALLFITKNYLAVLSPIPWKTQVQCVACEKLLFLTSSLKKHENVKGFSSTQNTGHFCLEVATGGVQ